MFTEWSRVVIRSLIETLVVGYDFWGIALIDSGTIFPDTSYSMKLHTFLSISLSAPSVPLSIKLVVMKNVDWTFILFLTMFLTHWTQTFTYSLEWFLHFCYFLAYCCPYYWVLPWPKLVIVIVFELKSLVIIVSFSNFHVLHPWLLIHFWWWPQRLRVPIIFIFKLFTPFSLSLNSYRSVIGCISSVPDKNPWVIDGWVWDWCSYRIFIDSPGTMHVYWRVILFWR